MSDLDARREEKRTHLVVEKPAVDMIRCEKAAEPTQKLPSLEDEEPLSHIKFPARACCLASLRIFRLPSLLSHAPMRVFAGRYL